MYNKATIIFLAFLNLAGFLAVVVVNSLATLLPINNKSTGALSDQYPNLFVPAGLTFSIWGIIYLLLGIFTVYLIVAAFRQKTADSGIIEKTGVLYFISSLLNVGWILAWHYEIVFLSLIIMVLLFAVLLAIYLRLKIGKSDEKGSFKFLAFLPFSIYLGWITVATIANVTAFLVNLGWNGFGLSEQFWAVLVIAVAILIALAVLMTRNDIFYCLVVDWALLGILLKRMGDTGTQAQSVIIVAIIGMVLITLGIIIQPAVKKRIY